MVVTPNKIKGGRGEGEGRERGGRGEGREKGGEGEREGREKGKELFFRKRRSKQERRLAFVIVFKMAALSSGEGKPTYNTLSKRPGRRTAGSIMSDGQKTDKAIKNDEARRNMYV